MHRGAARARRNALYARIGSSWLKKSLSGLYKQNQRGYNRELIREMAAKTLILVRTMPLLIDVCTEQSVERYSGGDAKT
jgi:hypothetical protein